MAGHSKWANIQHRKKAQDAKRNKVFTRLIREVNVAARKGGGDPDANPRLRLAIDKALSQNVPKDRIENAIKRATGGEDDERPVEEVRYEGYGPGGVAVMVDCMTDNRNRTVAEVRHAFNKYGGKLGTDGSVAFLFEQKGVLSYPAEVDEDALMEAALEAGAEELVTNDDGSYDVLTAPEEFVDVRTRMNEAGFSPEQAEVTQRASTTAHIEGEQAESMLKLFEMLEDLDDVQDVYSNADIDEEVVAAL